MYCFQWIVSIAPNESDTLSSLCTTFFCTAVTTIRVIFIVVAAIAAAAAEDDDYYVDEYDFARHTTILLLPCVIHIYMACCVH